MLPTYQGGLPATNRDRGSSVCFTHFRAACPAGIAVVAAGALIFELRQTDTGARNVHAYYTAQSLEDMHQGTGTSAVQTPVPMSACPNGSFCTLDEFTKLVGPMLDPNCS